MGRARCERGSLERASLHREAVRALAQSIGFARLSFPPSALAVNRSHSIHIVEPPMTAHSLSGVYSHD
jgi:hypothetical protein